MPTNLKNREVRINWIYNHYLTGASFEEIKASSQKLDPEQEEAVKSTLENLSTLEGKVIPLLKDDWKWERIQPLEKSVLINGAAELILFGNKKTVVISETNKLIVRYIGEENITYIQAILDKIA